ncbi:MAG: serine/threonine protein kinase [Anaerolineales bacterium]|nr:serine/threonine protein kinase [Anaerolineales bacterium]
MTNLIGQTIMNRFRVDAFSGSDEKSETYRAWDLQRNLPVAMKMLHSNLASNPPLTSLLQQASSSLQNLSHPNLAPYLGFYQASGSTFALEQWIDGPSLGDVMRLRQGQPFSAQEALIILKALSAALDYLQDYSWVHNGIQPDHVRLDQSGNVYLTEVGFCWRSGSAAAALGSPAYMAPEQFKGQPLTSGVDVYALGILVFELLTGHHPFGGAAAAPATNDSTTIQRLRQAHLTLPPPNPRALNPAISESLANVMMRAIAKDPEDRYLSASAFFEAVCDTLATVPERVPARMAVAAAATQVAAPSAQPTARMEQPVAAPQIVLPTSRLEQPDSQSAPVKRPVWIWAVVGVLGLSVLLCLGIFLGSRIPSIVSGLFGSATPTIASIATAVPTIAPTQAVIPTNTSRPGAQGAPTQPPTPIPTPTPMPTDRPAPTLLPTITPSQNKIEVRVYNRMAFQVEVWLDDRKTIKATLDTNKYMGFFNISIGDHVIHYCRADDPSNCGKKDIYVSTDSPSFNRDKNAFITEIP